MLDADDPFHAGERRAQVRAGVPDVAEWAGVHAHPIHFETFGSADRVTCTGRIENYTQPLC